MQLFGRRFDMAKILDRYGKVIFESEGTLKETVIKCVSEHTSLAAANLAGANLADANLTDAYLYAANLTAANLTAANLDGANLDGANLDDANLTDAYLYAANLTAANLTAANLYAANLDGANLTDANLTDANLAGANLARAKGINPEKCTPLLILQDQPGKIRAYKLVNKELEGPYNGGIKYKTGEEINVPDANTDVNEQCAAGINVATLDWCLRNWQEGYKVMLVEFTAQDIAAIPTATDGKFRLRRCKVIGEKDIGELV
jgi:hypothetical protein